MDIIEFAYLEFFYNINSKKKINSHISQLYPGFDTFSNLVNALERDHICDMYSCM